MKRALLIGLLLAGCAQTSVSVSTGSPAPVTTSAAPSPSAVALGQAVTVTSDSGSAAVTVLSVRYHSAGIFNEAPLNGQYAVADVEITGGAGRFDYNPALIAYQSADQRVYSFTDGHAIVAGYGPQLRFGSLAAGQTVRGFVTFDVPRGTGQDVQVSMPGGSTVAEWKLR